MHKRKKYIRFLSVALAFSLIASTASFAAKHEMPAVSPEGLKLIKSKNVRVVYMADGADFSGYDKVIIMDSYVAFKKDWKRDQNMSSITRVNDKDIARIKTRLAAEVKKVFSAELAATGQTVVTEAGSNTLLLRPAIINLDIAAPDTREPGMSATISASAGQMTLYLELYDSVTSDLLARVIDPQADRGFGTFSVNNDLTNRVAADRILKKWAKLLGEYLQNARAAK
jgi:hypothetical protein